MKKIFPSLFVFAFLSLQLNGQILISNVSGNVQPNNVLRYDVSFTSSSVARGQVKYGYWDGNDSIWNSSQVSGTGTNHNLSIIGLYPQTDYVFRVLAFDSTGCDSSNNMSFSTAALPSGMGIANLDSVWTAAGNSPSGYVLTGNSDANPNRMMQLYDRNGELIWYETMPGNPSDSADGLFQHFNYTKENQSIFFSQSGRILEIALDGTVLTDIDVHAIDSNMYPHHDVFRNQDGNLVALVAIIDTVDKSSVGGSANSIVVGHGIIEVDNAGNLVWDWNSFNYYDPVNSPAPGGYWTPRFGPDAIDWKHANSLSQDLDGNYLLSFGGAHDVLKIDRQTKNPLWTIGRSGNIDVAPQDSFISQQSFRAMPNGNYLLWDGESMGNQSRVSQWWIDWGYSTPMIMVQWDYVLPQAWFSPNAGNVEAIQNGNMFFSAGDTRAIFEVQPVTDSLFWFARQNSTFYRAFWLEDLYDRSSLTYTGETAFCLTDTAETLIASPAGGFWSGNGLNNGVFDPSSAGAGAHTLTYKYGTGRMDVLVNVDDDPNCSVAIDVKAGNIHGLRTFPNPFSENIVMDYELLEKQMVEVCIFSTDGREIAVLFEGQQQPGEHRLSFDLAGLNLPAGPVFLRIRTNDGRHSTRVIWKQ